MYFFQPMYFLNLRAFDTVTGVITANQGKFPFIAPTGGLFEPDERNVERGGVAFRRIETEDNHIYYISEPNILKIIDNQKYAKNGILENHVKPLDSVATNELLQHFYEGYRAGFDELYKELGQSFFSFGLDHRKEILRSFINYCHEMLYFEGFAIPDLLYALGFIQVNLVRAEKEYTNIERLKEKPLALPEINLYPQINISPEFISQANEQLAADAPQEPPPAAEIPASTDNEIESKLLLHCPPQDVAQLWYVLIDPVFCKEINLSRVFETESDILTLLGTLFSTPTKVPKYFLDSEPQYFEMPSGYQSVLCVLMHATYKLNLPYEKLPLKLYCELLKKSFSPFKTIESVSDIVSNINKKVDIAVVQINASKGKYAKKTVNILRKMRFYKLGD
jgi:hypothetical protein